MRAEVRAKIRAWITPFTLAVFVLLAVTGFVMEGHNSGAGALHQTLGYTFCAIALAHIALNWQILVAQMKKATALVAVLMVGILGSLIWIGAANGAQDRHSSQVGQRSNGSDQNSAVIGNHGQRNRHSARDSNQQVD